MNLSLFFDISLLSVILTYGYKTLWNLSSLRETTATGYGLLLIILLFSYSLFFNELNIDTTVLFFILFFSLIYWYDDIKYLSSNFRFFLQFISGFTIATVLLLHYGYILNFYFLSIIIISGLINIFFSNVVNFYDGLDLNISTFSIILGITFIFLLDDKVIQNYYGIIIIGFIVGFSYFNIKPNNIFFGDSGCFILACLINFIIVKSFLISNITIVFLLIPLSLPIIDVLYVLVLRIYINESLLSRNYHHLYHKLESKYQKKYYLIPQILNSIILFILSNIFIKIDSIDQNLINIFIISSIILTFFLYLFIRNFYKLND
jgi:UDP-N-acetylmuramyl pentapeptide phosphotransferase/UDP-N-acetylglucosamine-1-phosphate transferase